MEKSTYISTFSCLEMKPTFTAISVPEQATNIILSIQFAGKVCSKFSKEGPTPSQVVQKINMKCVEARRPPRVRVLQIQNSPSSEEL